MGFHRYKIILDSGGATDSIYTIFGREHGDWNPDGLGIRTTALDLNVAHSTLQSGYIIGLDDSQYEVVFLKVSSGSCVNAESNEFNISTVVFPATPARMGFRGYVVDERTACTVTKNGSFTPGNYYDFFVPYAQGQSFINDCTNPPTIYYRDFEASSSVLFDGRDSYYSFYTDSYCPRGQARDAQPFTVTIVKIDSNGRGTKFTRSC